MYRCKECNATYKDKVEYCECGNNTFEYIEDKPQHAVHKQQTKITPADKLKKKSDIVSFSFLAICIILSILIWVFAGNTTKPTKKQKTSIPKQQKVINKNIPNINQIWDDTPMYQPQYNIQQNGQQPEVINRDNPIPLTSTPADYLRRIRESEKIIQKPKQQIYYPPKQNQQETNKNSATKENVQQPNKQKPQTSEPKPIQTIVETPKPAPKPKLPAYDPNDPELLNYKSALRNALFSRLAVGSIRGSGTCIIEFSINKQTGKLENRRFVEQSNNKGLNDSIYYMLMSVPKFNTPPDCYNGEKLRMKFYFNNGYYEISYI